MATVAAFFSPRLPWVRPGVAARRAELFGLHQRSATRCRRGHLHRGLGAGPVFAGSPVVTGPAAMRSQSFNRCSACHRLSRVRRGERAVSARGCEQAGLLPLAEHVLKFRLPPLPPGKTVRYRFTARTVGWVKVRQFYHGELKAGEPQTSRNTRFRTLDTAADTTTFAVWNDTHENTETLKSAARNSRRR